MIVFEWLTELVAAVMRGDRSWRPFLSGILGITAVAVLLYLVLR